MCYHMAELLANHSIFYIYIYIYTRDVPKIFGQTSRLGSLRQNKEWVCINIRQVMCVWFLALLEMSHSQIIALTVFHFTCNWHNRLTKPVSNLIIVELFLFIKPQYAEDVQNVLYLNERTHRQVWSWTVASFPRSRGCFECFDRRQKGVGGVSSFAIGAEYSRVLKCLHKKDLKECGQHIFGLYL
jgi:hypothetical protein